MARRRPALISWYTQDRLMDVRRATVSGVMSGSAPLHLRRFLLVQREHLPCARRCPLRALIGCALILKNGRSRNSLPYSPLFPRSPHLLFHPLQLGLPPLHFRDQRDAPKLPKNGRPPVFAARLANALFHLVDEFSDGDRLSLTPGEINPLQDRQAREFLVRRLPVVAHTHEIQLVEGEDEFR